MSLNSTSPSRTSGTLQQRVRDEARFFKAWVENPVATGAVSPSGRFLSRAMARHVDGDIPGLVIELGPGTGPVTQALVNRGIAPERLVLVEFDEKFCDLLKARFPQARVVRGDAYNLAETLRDVITEPVAAIVSSLPLLNRPDEDRVRLLQDSFAMLHPQGNFVQFTYGMISPIPRSKADSAEMAFEMQGSAPVWLNLPPARVFSYRPARDATSADGNNPAAAFLARIRTSAWRVRDELLERRDRIGTEFRLARDRVRIDIELRAAHLRDTPPARRSLEFLKKLAEQRSRDRF